MFLTNVYSYPFKNRDLPAGERKRDLIGSVPRKIPVTNVCFALKIPCCWKFSRQFNDCHVIWWHFAMSYFLDNESRWLRYKTVTLL